MKELSFYDVKARKPFMSKSYTIETDSRGRQRAVCMAPSGVKAYRYLPSM